MPVDVGRVKKNFNALKSSSQLNLKNKKDFCYNAIRAKTGIYQASTTMRDDKTGITFPVIVFIAAVVFLTA